MWRAGEGAFEWDVMEKGGGVGRGRGGGTVAKLSVSYRQDLSLVRTAVEFEITEQHRNCPTN